MLLKNPKTIAKTIAQAIWKNIAIVQYFCCLKNYLNTAFFEKKYCNRVFAIFYCAITMVWRSAQFHLSFLPASPSHASLLRNNYKNLKNLPLSNLLLPNSLQSFCSNSKFPPFVSSFPTSAEDVQYYKFSWPLVDQRFSWWKPK